MQLERVGVGPAPEGQLRFFQKLGHRLTLNGKLMPQATGLDVAKSEVAELLIRRMTLEPLK